MRAAGPAPAASRPALANDASSPLQSPADRVFWLAAAAVLGALLILLGVEHYWLRDLKFDDAYIHFRYAENIAQGEGFVYNPGERVLGSGAIPWNLMLAVIAALAPPGTLPVAVSVLEPGGARHHQPSRRHQRGEVRRRRRHASAAGSLGLPRLRLRDGRSPPPPHLDVQLIGRRGGTAPVHYQEHQCQTRNNDSHRQDGCAAAVD